MITIVKGSSKLVVTRGTYEEQFKALGYRIASNNEEATKKVASFVEEEKKDNQNNVEKTLEDLSKEDKNENEDLSDKYGLKLNKKTTTGKRGKK